MHVVLNINAFFQVHMPILCLQKGWIKLHVAICPARPHLLIHTQACTYVAHARSNVQTYTHACGWRISYRHMYQHSETQSNWTDSCADQQMQASTTRQLWYDLMAAITMLRQTTTMPFKWSGTIIASPCMSRWHVTRVHACVVTCWENAK